MRHHDVAPTVINDDREICCITFKSVSSAHVLDQKMVHSLAVVMKISVLCISFGAFYLACFFPSRALSIRHSHTNQERSHVSKLRVLIKQ